MHMIKKHYLSPESDSWEFWPDRCFCQSMTVTTEDVEELDDLFGDE